MLAGDGSHAVGEEVLASALVDEVEGCVEVVVSGGVGEDVLVEGDDELVAVAAYAHVVIEGAGDKGVDFVVADGGTKLFGTGEGGAEAL